MIMIIEINQLGFNDVMNFPRYLDNNSKYFIVSIINTIQFFIINNAYFVFFHTNK